MLHFRIGCAVAALLAPMAVQAQETTASLRGQVTDLSGNPVSGATVTVTHVPSGTRTVQVSDASGGFNASGLRLGGPIKVDVTAAGYDEASAEVGFLTAGVAQRINVVMAEAGQTITVTAGREQRSTITLGTGAVTVLNARDIAGVSNVNRDIRNLAARDPLVTIDPTNNGAISIAGQNNRFNRFTVDGVAFGDPFGLESGGLVSTRGPVPLDAIGEFSVEVAPVDIQQGFFQGGAINTQLKSGGNEFSFLGGAYYQDDRLRGTTSRGVTRAGAFESQIYTAQATGPIIKDRLFFAVTYERTRDTVPSNVNPSQLGISTGQIDLIGSIAQSVYNFDTQGVADGIVEKDDKLVAKFDLNVADGHRLTATYIWNESSVLAGQTGTGAIGASNPNFALRSNNYTQGAKNHFGIIQSNNQWSDEFSTQLRVSYADYVRLQVPFGDRAFGQFQTCLDETSGGVANRCTAGSPLLTFGPDISRQANELDSQSLAVEFQATLKRNNHTVKLIAERRRQDVRNLFAQRVSGAWYFDSVADLQGQRANELDLAVPIRGGIDTVTAEFQNNSWTFGIMDTVDLSDNLTVVAGFRWDLFDTPDAPFYNNDFIGRFGFSNNSTLNGRSLFQPRFGVNWKPNDRLQVRGSAGLFGGGNPLVWISNNYSNPGPTLGRIQVRRATNGTFSISGLSGLSAEQVQQLGAGTLNGVTGGTGVPAALLDAVRSSGSAEAPTNALDPNFQPPSQWRLSGSVDYEADFGPLGDGWNLGADLIWSRVKNALEWTDLRSVPVGTLPDGRPRYAALPGTSPTASNSDFLLTNITQGYSWNAVARFDKRWMNGFRLSGAYTFQRAKDGNAGTSSVAGSNYGNAAALDPNFAAVGTSNYQRSDAFRLIAGYDAELFGDNNTRVELFLNARSGQPYSYTFADVGSAGRAAVFGVTGRDDRNLLYVPNVSNRDADPLVRYANTFDFAGFQSFIQNSELNDYQGKIAPKNLGRSPWNYKLDLSVRQELPFVLGGKIELLADVENVLNLLNSSWGSIRQVGFPYYATLANVACDNNTTCGQYVYSNVRGSTFRSPSENVNLNGSLWGVRFGARVKF